MNRFSIAAVVAAVACWFALNGLPWPARALALFLLVLLPALALAQTRTLARTTALAEEAGGQPTPLLPRLPVYAASAVTLWLIALATVVAAWASGFTTNLIGLRSLPLRPFLAWLVFLLASALLLYAMGRYFGFRETRVLRELLPRSARERVAFIGLSITAGVCEELVFRGFLIPTLTVATNSMLFPGLVSSAVFGLLHAYQSPTGALRAALLGLALAIPFVASGSLYPSIVGHTLIDVAGGLWLAREPDPDVH